MRRCADTLGCVIETAIRLRRGSHSTDTEGARKAVREAIRNELVPWLLGYSDPVRMRVAKRGEIEVLPEDLAE